MEPLDYEPATPPRSPGIWRRLPATIALAGVIATTGLLAAMWCVALLDGQVEFLLRHYSLPSEFRGNHGPWRHHRVLRELDGYTSALTMFVLVPAALLGAVIEPTRRAGVVLLISVLLLLASCAHFPLFD